MKANELHYRLLSIPLTCLTIFFILFFQANAFSQSKDNTVLGSYPTRTVKIIAPGAGSGTDITARIIAKNLQMTWGQAVIIENKPGAGGSIGINSVINSAPDGYTLLANSATYAINPSVYKKLPYDAVRSLVDVSLLTTTPYVLVTNFNSPYKNMDDLVQASKKINNTITFGSAGIGSSTHLAAEYFQQAAGIKNTHIPYKSSPEVLQDVLSGRVDYFMAPFDTSLGYISSNKLRALGISSKERLPQFSQYKTIAEQGYPNFELNFWVGIWAPAEVPKAVVQKINQDMNKALQDPEVKILFNKSGIQIQNLDQEQFHKFVQSEMQKYSTIVKLAGISPE